MIITSGRAMNNESTTNVIFLPRSNTVKIAVQCKNSSASSEPSRSMLITLLIANYEEAKKYNPARRRSAVKICGQTGRQTASRFRKVSSIEDKSRI